MVVVGIPLFPVFLFGVQKIVWPSGWFMKGEPICLVLNPTKISMLILQNY